MAGEKPFFIRAQIVDIPPGQDIALVKVINGSLYTITCKTPGIKFDQLTHLQILEIEITTRLGRVFSARTI